MRVKQIQTIAMLLVAVATTADACWAQSLGFVTPQQNEVHVSPATPGTTPGTLGSENETTGANPLTGLPCTGAGSLAISGAGQLADTTTPPPGEVDNPGQVSIALPSQNSVFGSAVTPGAC